MLDTLVQVLVLTDAANAAGFYVSPDQVKQQILSHPDFHVEGIFSEERYRDALRGAYLTDRDLREEIHNVLLLEQYQSGVISSAFAVPHELEELVKFVNQKRSVEYVTVPRARFHEEITVADKTVRAYYDKHTTDYVKPKQVKLDYLELALPAIQVAESITQDEVVAYYNAHKSQFIRPERVHAAHILIAVPEHANEAAVKKAKEEVLMIESRLKAGESFEKLAKEFSADPVSGKRGGDLDWFTRGQMVEPFEHASFSVAVGSVSEPVRTTYGFHLIKILGREPESTVSVADASDAIGKTLRRQKAEEHLAEMVEKLSASVYEHPNTLVKSSEELNLTIRTSPFFDKLTKDKLFGLPAIQEAVFSNDVLEHGRNSDVIQIGDNHYVVLRVVDQKSEEQLPFAKVKDSIRDMLRDKEANELTLGLAKDFLLQAQQEKHVDAVAKRLKLTATTLSDVTRGSDKLAPEVVRALFQLPKSQDGAVSGTTVVLNNGDVMALVLGKVTYGSWHDLDANTQEAYTKGLTQSYGEYDFALFRKQAYDSADIEILVKL